MEDPVCGTGTEPAAGRIFGQERGIESKMNISNNYTVLGQYGQGSTIRQTQKTEERMVRQKETAEGTKAKESGLSGKAQALLEKLNRTYGNVEFLAVQKDGDAKAALAGGTREFSVVLTNEELEKMAADENYEKECLSRVEGAMRMSEQINQEFGMESVPGRGEITRMGVSFDQNGLPTYFAELTKTADAGREQVREAAKKRAEEKQQTEELTKKVLVTAGSAAELSEKIRNVDWDAVEGFEEAAKGKIFDYSI